MNIIERRRYTAALRTWTDDEIVTELDRIQRIFLHPIAECSICTAAYNRREIALQEQRRREHDRARA